MLWDYILHYAFATVAGRKAGSLFRVPHSLWDPSELFSLLQTLQLQCVPVQASRQSILLFLYDPEQVISITSHGENNRFLTQLGYPKNPVSSLSYLLTKMGQGASFPHEVGLFLGYPLQDVQGYIKNHGRSSLYTGYWKVYHDVEGAKKRFALFDMCKQRCLEARSAGAAPEEILQFISKGNSKMP